MTRTHPDDPRPLTPHQAPQAEVLTLAQARERSRKLQIARSIRQGTYKPDLNALASTLLKQSLTQGITTED